MRVLVTGHKGYIGTVLVPMLLQQNHEVIGLDSDLYEKCTFGVELAEVSKIEPIPEIRMDLRDIRPEVLEGFEAIIHLAGLSNDPLGDLNINLTYEINHKASLRLAEFAKLTGVRRFIFSSSCSNYGAAGENMIDEEAEFNPVTPYGRSKVLVEKDVSALASAAFCPVFLRNATAYGVSPRLRFDLVLNNLVAWACTTGRVFIKSDGSPWRPIVHIEDISRAFIAALHAPEHLVHNKAFNVGRNQDNYRIRDLAEIVCQVVPGCRIEYALDGGPDKRCYRVDCSKISRTLPEFRPQWNAKKGAVQLFQAIKQANLTPADFEGSRFQRVAHIKHLMETNMLDLNLRWKNHLGNKNHLDETNNHSLIMAESDGNYV